MIQHQVVQAMLAKEPSHGQQLRERLRLAIGPLSEAINDGQIYATLTRRERADSIPPARFEGQPIRSLPWSA